MADEIFANPRLAALYDPLDPGRGDLDPYVRLTEEIGARRVLDIGWICGNAAALPPLQVDLATMTANVAQEIFDQDDWQATLRGAYAALRPGGHLVFETRDPARRAWEAWNRESSHRVTEIPGADPVENWVDVTAVAGALVSFRRTYVFAAGGEVLTSESTLRFRERQEIEADLRAAGFVVREVRDAPDRPGKELVFIARRPDPAGPR
ncbi:SAM-dependent methyltransferase [Streptomyces rubiginosohelvolus]